MVKVSISIEQNPQSIFYPGQVVIGEVQVETRKQLKTRGIRAEVIGKAHVYWSESYTDADGNTQSTSYSGNETYMDFTLNLTESDAEDNNPKIYLEPGIHHFPFSFTLPPTLPSTFHANCGSVTYEIKAVVIRVKKRDDKAKIEITVIRLLDLNYEPQDLKEPLLVEVNQLQKSCCLSCCCRCCCIEGDPQINLTLNRGCFVAGETMIVGGEIANRTDTKIKSIVVEFMQHREYWANTSTGENYTSTSGFDVLASVTKPGVKSGQTQNLDDISFNIPPLPASRLDGCSIINIEYYIKVTVVFSGCCSPTCWAKQDVIIGNIPLYSSTITSQPRGCSLCYPSTESNNRWEPMNCSECGISNAGFECTECRQIAIGPATDVRFSPTSTIN